MCLISKDKEPKIAKDDIICYKCLVPKKFLFWERYYSPIYLFRFKIEKLYKDRSSISCIPFDIGTNTYHSISKGVFHSFSKLIYAEAYSCGKPTDIFKCVIPKGTEYYESDCDTQYASKSIKVLKLERKNNKQTSL